MRKDKGRRSEYVDPDVWAKSQNQDRSAITLPQGVEAFKPKKKGTYKIEVIPYKIKKSNPYVREGKAEPGQMVAERTFYIHFSVGPDNRAVICSARSFGKPCAVCDYATKLGSAPDRDKETDELIKALKPRQRQLWNVYDRKEPGKGVQVWDESYHNFGKGVAEKILNSDEEDRSRIRNFWHKDKGLTLKVLAKEDSFMGRSFMDCTDVEFHKREKPVPADVFGQAVCLDDLVKMPDYDDVKRLLSGGADGEDEDEEDEEDGETDSGDEDDEDGVDAVDDDGEGEEEDDEEDGEEEDEGGEEGDGDDDEEDDEDGDSAVAVGDHVKGEYQGKKFRGRVVKVDRKHALARVKTTAGKVRIMDFDDLTVTADSGKKKSQDDDDEDEPAPRRKKNPRKDDDGDMGIPF
jgi:hypothetical protein